MASVDSGEKTVPPAWMVPSRYALDNVGQWLTWTVEKPRPRRVEGLCIGVKRTPGVMRTEDGDWPCIQLLLQGLDGKAVWTSSFADREPGEDVADEDEWHKVCTECGGVGPIGGRVDHRDGCSGSPNLCTVKRVEK